MPVVFRFPLPCTGGASGINWTWKEIIRGKTFLKVKWRSPSISGGCRGKKFQRKKKKQNHQIRDANPPPTQHQKQNTTKPHPTKTRSSGRGPPAKALVDKVKGAGLKSPGLSRRLDLVK